MAKPDVYITKNGDTITIKTESTIKSSQLSFKLGEKCEENTLDGRKVQVSTRVFCFFFFPLNTPSPLEWLGYRYKFYLGTQFPPLSHVE